MLFIVFFLTLNVYSQSSKSVTVYKSDNTQLTFTGDFSYKKGKIKTYSKKEGKIGANIYDVNDIIKVVDDKGVYEVKNFENSKQLFKEVIKGELSLYRDVYDENKYYLENSEIPLKKLPLLENINFITFKTGTVLLFINKCKSASNLLYKNPSITLFRLRKIIEKYNECKLETQLEIADKVIEESNKPKETLELGLSFGLMNSKINYGNIVTATKNNINYFLGGKLFFNSNILKKNELRLDLSFDYFFKQKSIIENTDYKLSHDMQRSRISLGINYVFRNISPVIRPYVGVSGGIMINSKSKINFQDFNSIVKYKTYLENNYFPYSLRVGALVNVFSQVVDVLVSYYPVVSNPLKGANALSVNDYYYTISGMSLRVTYIPKFKK